MFGHYGPGFAAKRLGGISPGKRPPRLIYHRRPLNNELLLRE